jgi:hypothetical protein
MCDSDAREALGSKKTRKEPQRISETTWKLVESAVCVGGLGFTECGRKFGVTPHAIMQRAKRHGWPVPSKIAKRVEALQKSVTERAVCERNRACNDKVVDTIAESWVERGEAHRSLIYDMTRNALRKVVKSPPALEDWSSIEKADKAARRACGLDDSEATRNTNIGLQLIEQRLEIIDLPKEID